MVEVFPRYQDAVNPLKLTLVDKQKHFEGKIRKGKVIATGPDVSEVRVGDVVVFEACDGFTLDGDPMDAANPLKGESFRWLKQREIMAVEEPVEAIA